MSDKLLDATVTNFLHALASDAPAPGGGSVAALSGALGAALISMVCNLTLGKKRYAAVQDEIADLLAKAEQLRADLTGLVEADVAAFSAVSAAYKHPRGTEAEKQARSAAIQAALKTATAVPMQVAEACAQVLDLCPPAADKGNPNVVSDVGVAVLMAEAGLRSAALNILINLKALRDRAFCQEMDRRLAALLDGKPALKERIYDQVVAQIGG